MLILKFNLPFPKPFILDWESESRITSRLAFELKLMSRSTINDLLILLESIKSELGLTKFKNLKSPTLLESLIGITNEVSLLVEPFRLIKSSSSGPYIIAFPSNIPLP